jgi:hypothetical protein
MPSSFCLEVRVMEARLEVEVNRRGVHLAAVVLAPV